MAQPLRRLLPKAESQMQLEPFVLQPTTTRDFLPHDASRTRSPTTSNSMSRRSLGQKRRREKEARENYKPETSELASYRRSEAQKARRQRELAAVMEHDLLCKDRSSDSTHTVRSRAQRFRRRVEKAQKSLAANPDCDLTDSLRRILDLNIDRFSRHQGESYRDRMSRLYPANFL
ncbi:hypothetical protein C8J57DRAFT_1464168 [Mycena rebaudengoi]|nr:hypothetical protein C8J57DRAFT_1464168 [Mycena rebaudengoi]